MKSGRGYYIEENKKVVSMAKSTSENSTHAMVVGVGTHPMYRKKGYATKCVVKLCNSLLNDKKIPCLFYDNEEAGKIYKKIGFKELGQWVNYYKWIYLKEWIILEFTPFLIPRKILWI